VFTWFFLFDSGFFLAEQEVYRPFTRLLFLLYTFRHTLYIVFSSQIHIVSSSVISRLFRTPLD